MNGDLSLYLVFLKYVVAASLDLHPRILRVVLNTAASCRLVVLLILVCSSGNQTVTGRHSTWSLPGWCLDNPLTGMLRRWGQRGQKAIWCALIHFLSGLLSDLIWNWWLFAGSIHLMMYLIVSVRIQLCSICCLLMLICEEAPRCTFTSIWE